MTNEIMTTNGNGVQAVEYAPIEGYINTYDLTTTEGKMATIQHLNDTKPLKHTVGEVLDVCDVITEPGVRRGRNGMPDTACQNTYLITKDGESYFSQSDGVARSIRTICTMFPDMGKGSEKGCISLALKETALENGNTLKTLVPVF